MTRPNPAGGEPADAVRRTEARIAAVLARLAEASVDVDGAPAPPAYLRRHLVEHAAAGGVLNDRTLPATFLPYVDAVRLRAAAGGASSSLSLLPVVRQVAHEWDWARPDRNATAVTMRAALAGRPVDTPLGGAWFIRAAPQGSDTSEVLPVDDFAQYLAIATLPDGQAVVVVCPGGRRIRIWDLTTGTQRGEPLMASAQVRAVASATLRDGRVVAVTGDSAGTVQMWDLARLRRIGRPMTGDAAVSALACGALPDGRVIVAAGTGRGTLHRWNLADATPLGPPIEAHGSGVWHTAIVSTAAGAPVIVTTDGAGLLRSWAADTGEPIIAVPTGHDSGVTAMTTASLPGVGAVAMTSGTGGRLRVWDLDTGGRISDTEVDDRRLVLEAATAVLPDGRTVAVTTCRDGSVQLWQLPDGRPLGEPARGHVGGCWEIAGATLPDGRSVAVTGGFCDRTVRVWDLALLAGQNRPAPFPAAREAARGWTVDTTALPDGRHVAVTGATDGAVTSWDVTTGRELTVRRGAHRRAVHGVAAAPLSDGRVVAVTVSRDDRSARVWNLPRLTRTGTLRTGHRGGVSAVAASGTSGGPTIGVTGGVDGTVRIWNLDEGVALTPPLPGHAGSVTAAAVVAPPGQGPYALTVGMDASLRRWEPGGGPAVELLRTGHPYGLVALAAAVLPDGRAVAVTCDGYSRGGSILRYDLDRRAVLGPALPWDPHTVSDLAVAVSIDERPLVVAVGGQGVLRVWDLDTGEDADAPLWHADSMAVAVHQAPRGPVVVIAGCGVTVADLMLRG